MKGTITVVGNDIKLILAPENDIERLAFRELGEDMSISRSHHDIVLRRRGPIVHALGRIDDEMVDGFEFGSESIEEVEEADETTG